ncbi:MULTISPECIES: hypothetical protein [Streptomyces]|uniref:hypothetical protein n=1 Tax=Streptomyces TaxID=1883 RepID=UPI00117DA6B8|nr:MULTISPECIES: hypothetical protein [Streptomyces]
MSAVRREWRDSGSAFGHMQAVADSGTYSRIQTAYRAYITHATACEGCGHGQAKCTTADQLWRAYKAARS